MSDHRDVLAAVSGVWGDGEWNLFSLGFLDPWKQWGSRNCFVCDINTWNLVWMSLYVHPYFKKMCMCCGLRSCWLWKQPDFCFLPHNLPKKELEEESGCFWRPEMKTALNFRTERSEMGLTRSQVILALRTLHLSLPCLASARQGLGEWLNSALCRAEAQRLCSKLIQKWQKFNVQVWFTDSPTPPETSSGALRDIHLHYLGDESEIDDR